MEESFCSANDLDKAKEYRWSAVDNRVYSNVSKLKEEANFIISSLKYPGVAKENKDKKDARIKRAHEELKFLFNSYVEEDFLKFFYLNEKWNHVKRNLLLISAPRF